MLGIPGAAASLHSNSFEHWDAQAFKVTDHILLDLAAIRRADSHSQQENNRAERPGRQWIPTMQTCAAIADATDPLTACMGCS